MDGGQWGESLKKEVVGCGLWAGHVCLKHTSGRGLTHQGKSSRDSKVPESNVSELIKDVAGSPFFG